MRPLSLAHMILGLLLDAPAHGYELRRCLAPFFGAGTPLNAGLLYPALAKLEARGWVTKRSVRRPPTVSTVAGERPVRYDFFHRDPLLARVVFFRHLSGDRLRVMLRDQVAQAEARCDDYTQVRAGMLARKADPYRIRVLDFGLRYHRLRCAWITELLAGLDRQRRPSPSPRRRRR